MENARILRGWNKVRFIYASVPYDGKRVRLLNYLKEEFGKTNVRWNGENKNHLKNNRIDSI
jgi:hypothetical protein